MKKHQILCSLAAILLPLAMNAQTPITLNKSNVTGRVPGPFHTREISGTGLASPQLGANQTWDYSGTTVTSTLNGNLLTAPAFSNTAVQDTGLHYMFAQSPNTGFFVYPVYDIDDLGLFYAGDIMPYSPIPISGYTGNSKDTLYCLQQNIKYRENAIPFPATMGTSWTTKYQYPINMEMSIANYGLNKTPFKFGRHVIIKDTVVGWGSLKIPSANKSSIAYDVLLVRRLYMQIDSFYLYNGNTFVPSPSNVLQVFSMFQNDTTDVIQSEYFVRAGSGHLLMSIGYPYGDNTYSKPSGAACDADNIQSGIEEGAYNTGDLKVFPNPAQPGPLNLEFEKPSGAPWNLSVVNLLGQTAKIMKIEGTGSRKIQLDCNGYNQGLYLVNITDGNGEMVMSSKFEITK